MKISRSSVIRFGFLLLVLVILSGCIIGKEGAILPAPEQEDIMRSLEPGLIPHYRYSFYRTLDQMPTDASMVSDGQQGQPVLFLNHTFTGNIFDSQKDKGVGVYMSGYLQMKTKGTYRFQAMSNDGIRVIVNQEVVVIDPKVHPDRLSDIGEISIPAPGWYPITVKYFQRKGTARLELYWQLPESDALEIVPPEAYGHKQVVQKTP